MEAETLSSNGNPRGDGNGDQLAQPGSNDGISKNRESSTSVSSNNQLRKAENLIESQRSHPAATTTDKQRDKNRDKNKEPEQQANNLCPYSLRSRSKISKKLGTSSP